MRLSHHRHKLNTLIQFHAIFFLPFAVSMPPTTPRQDSIGLSILMPSSIPIAGEASKYYLLIGATSAQPYIWSVWSARETRARRRPPRNGCQAAVAPTASRQRTTLLGDRCCERSLPWERFITKPADTKKNIPHDKQGHQIGASHVAPGEKARGWLPRGARR